jgi:membrane protein DedA with SNARE-associated domain
MSQFHTPMTLSFRFLYGLRTVVPFVIGMSTVSTKRFVLLNIVGAIVWAIVVGIVVGIGGYAFGHAQKYLSENSSIMKFMCLLRLHFQECSFGLFIFIDSVNVTHKK